MHFGPQHDGRLMKNSMEGSSTGGHTGRGLRAGGGMKAPITISPPGAARGGLGSA